jgi:hypothetical protein
MKIKYIALLLLLFSCSGVVNDSDEAASRITYFKDKRSGLCFAQVVSYSYSGYTVSSISNVPCDSVKHLLK